MKDAWQVARFVINGLGAAGVHFAVLSLLMEWVGLASAGLASLLAAVAGVTASFLGNRHFVFQATSDAWQGQALRFGVLYAFTALMHGAVLFGWTDVAGRDYRTGFLVATGLQVVASYLGNRWLVFRPLRN